MIKFDNSDKLMEYMAEHHETVILSFSRGKDSIAAWLQLQKYGIESVPVHMYTVPHLSFIDESLDYYEQVLGCKIYNMPHPSLYRLLNRLVFQAPEHISVIQDMHLQTYDYDDLFSIVKLAENLPVTTYTAVGVTQNDSLTRRSSISQHGAVNETRFQFFPIYDWSKKRILQEIGNARIKLPKDYRMFGRSFDGIDYRFSEPIKRFYPEDYKRIVELFPMVEIEVRRYEWRKQHLQEDN